MKKELGKIQDAEFGLGGYQDAMIGIRFSLGGDSWGVGDFWGDWSMKRSGSEQWTDADRTKRLGETTMRINQLLKDAKVDTVSKLKGVPIEVTFDGNKMVDWRVLKEVL